jgi:hypothetical protein
LVVIIKSNPLKWLVADTHDSPARRTRLDAIIIILPPNKPKELT